METQRTRILVHGLIAGLICYLVIALLFLAYDALLQRPLLLTVARLGAALTGSPLAGDVVTAPPVIAFNAAHLVLMLLVGMAASLVAHEWELHPNDWYAAFSVLTIGALLMTIGVGIYAVELAGAASWPAVLATNVVAAAAMAAYLIRVSRLHTA
ncbi:MAG TPA: hypothetical protein VK939_14250 [Longimicrobiales bacterium]|nr:hypothetical protein [Longimicrobiales bacterium]